MWSTGFLGCLLCGLTAVAVAGSPAIAGAADVALRRDLERLADQRIYFGHQSVGANLIEGVRQLAIREVVPLRIVEISGALEVAPRTFAHGPVPFNGEPTLKLANFARTLGSGPAVDVALVKFCFVDIKADTDVHALFAKYQATLAALKARYPDTAFVHVTVPLTTVERGVKAFVKRLLGRTPYGLVENARREELSALLRQAYEGREPIFDLARVESTAPDGRIEQVEWKGRAVPALVGAYTDDGGHLNSKGQLRAARELVSVLASLPERTALPGAKVTNR